MKLLRFFILSAFVLASTVGASSGMPASVSSLAVSRPGATHPYNGQLIKDSEYTSGITFTWTNTAGAGGSFDFELATDPTVDSTGAFVSTIDSASPSNPGGNTYSSSYTFTPATTYYWHVQAYDASSNPSGWSGIFTFRTSVVAPTLNAPAPGDVLANNLTSDDVNDTSGPPPGPDMTVPLFQWSSVTGSSGYVLQVSPSAAFSTLVLNVTIPASSTSYTPTKDLPANTTLYWRVQTLNTSTYGPSDWSSTCAPGVCSFITANPPSIPINLQPCDGCVDNDYTPGLGWQQPTLPGGTSFIAYEVQLSKDKTFKNSDKLCFDDSNSTTFDTPKLDVEDAFNTYGDTPGISCPTAIDPNSGATTLQPATTYYWRVRSVNQNTDSTSLYYNDYYYSDWSAITTLNTSYEQVDYTTFDPADGSYLDTNTYTFAWDVSSFLGTLPHSFGLQIFTSPTFRTGGVLNTVFNSNTSTFLVKNLPACQTLYWRVRATGFYGPGYWSDPAQIFSACPPSVPNLQAPANHTLLHNDTPTYKWSVVKVPFGYPFDYYEVQTAADKYFNNIIDDDTSTTDQFSPSYTLGSGLLIPGYTYYWRVRACDLMPDASDACSNWSALHNYKY
jgi:hypothetical protein